MDIYGVIGYPIKHSLSPAMHNAAFKAMGIDAEYRKFEIKPEELEGFLSGNSLIKDTEGKEYSARKIIGFNVTIPHKVRVFHLIEDNIIVFHAHAFNNAYFLADAVNTVRRDDDRIEYYNTDIYGFSKALISDLKFNTSDKCVFVFGCGGAGKAVIASLLQDGMNVRKLYVYDINKSIIDDAKKHFFKKEFAKIVRQRLEFVSHEQIAENIRVSELLVNASPLGMKEGDPSPIDKKLLHESLYVYDVVYNRETQLVKDVKLSFGEEHASGGLGMLLYQGVESLKFWLGEEKVPEDIVAIMREALNTREERI